LDKAYWVGRKEKEKRLRNELLGFSAGKVLSYLAATVKSERRCSMKNHCSVPKRIRARA